tara:strand:+ start:217 stop:468 length:252 start_codon:yes stop_codon:yes gene_type:complete
MFDFFLAPIGNAVFQASFYPTASFISWVPITLGGGGLFHVSMCAIVGVTSWGRTQEKIKNIIQNNNQDITITPISDIMNNETK